MKRIPIHSGKDENSIFGGDASHREIIEAFTSTYEKRGYVLPWIGYMFFADDEIAGCGGFKGRPVNGVVEIAYGTFAGFEGRGIASEICKTLVKLALQEDPSLKVRARTLPGKGASCRILEKNGFEYIGPVQDEEDGLVWEWEFKDRS